MFQDLIQKLVDIGLSDKEARVYVALVELGPSGVQEISNQSEVNRATTYSMLELLKERGLVSCYDQDKKTIFVAETPKKLVDLIEREARTLDEKRDKLVFFVPELEALYRTQRNKPVVRFYEGEEGLRSMRDYLTRTETSMYDSFIRLNQRLSEIAKHDEKRRLGIFRPNSTSRIIYVADEGIDVPFFPPEEINTGKTKVRFASAIPFDFEGEIGILDSVTYLASTAPNLMSCFMESEQFAKLMRAQFELSWAVASRERVNLKVP